MPDSLRPACDSAVADILNKSNGKVRFNSTDTSNVTGINFMFPTSDSTGGNYGWTTVEAVYPDGSPKRIKIKIARDLVNLGVAGKVFRRELGRAIGFSSTSLDPNYIMYINLPSTSVFHPDEGKAMQYLYTLNNLTNMDPYRDSVLYLGVNEEPQFLLPVNNTVKAYPNPANGFIRFDWSNVKQERAFIELYDISGRLVNTSEMGGKPGHQVQAMGIKDLSNGVYLYRFRCGESSQTGRFLKIK